MSYCFRLTRVDGGILRQATIGCALVLDYRVPISLFAMREASFYGAERDDEADLHWSVLKDAARLHGGIIPELGRTDGRAGW